MLRYQQCETEKPRTIMGKKTHFRSQTESMELDTSKVRSTKPRELSSDFERGQKQPIFNFFESKKKNQFMESYFKNIFKREHNVGTKMRKLNLPLHSPSELPSKKKVRFQSESAKSVGKGNIKNKCIKGNRKSNFLDKRNDLEVELGLRKNPFFNFDDSTLDF